MNNKIGALFSCARKCEIHIEFLLGNFKGRDHLERVDVDLIVIVKWILEMWSVTLCPTFPVPWICLIIITTSLEV
jgi:hypothetical protein